MGPVCPALTSAAPPTRSPTSRVTTPIATTGLLMELKWDRNTEDECVVERKRGEAGCVDPAPTVCAHESFDGASCDFDAVPLPVNHIFTALYSDSGGCSRRDRVRSSRPEPR